MSQSENHTPPEFSSRLFGLRKAWRWTQEEMAARLGISSNYVSLLEGGKKSPSSNLVKSLDLLESQREAGRAEEDRFSGGGLREEPPPVKAKERVKMIPVLSWAHAGEAESFEELPQSWQDQVPTECRDDKAFAVRLLGPSMEPDFLEGDLLVLQPSKPIYSGCLAVVRLANDGILFRRVEVRGDRLHLVPINPQYKTEEFTAEEISWAYPLWGMWRQVCK